MYVHLHMVPVFIHCVLPSMSVSFIFLNLQNLFFVRSCSLSSFSVYHLRMIFFHNSIPCRWFRKRVVEKDLFFHVIQYDMFSFDVFSQRYERTPDLTVRESNKISGSGNDRSSRHSWSAMLSKRIRTVDITWKKLQRNLSWYRWNLSCFEMWQLFR